MKSKIEVGDILLSTWGYDACIADFYKVIARKSKTIVMQRMSSTSSGDWVAGLSKPEVPEKLFGDPIRRLLKTNRDHEYVKCDHSVACVWNGNPVNTYNHH